MSIASEITRLQNAKASIKTAINNKGGTLTTETIDQYASAIDNLPSPKPEETKTVTPNFASGNIVVTPTSGKVMTQVTFTKPADMASKILNGETLMGVLGTGFPIDPNLTAENLKAGVTVYAGTPYEVVGTLQSAPSGFDVTITLSGNDYLLNDLVYAQYSLDNGSTWVNITAGVTLNTVSQIKFQIQSSNTMDYSITVSEGTTTIIDNPSSSSTYVASSNLTISANKIYDIYMIDGS